MKSKLFILTIALSTISCFKGIAQNNIGIGTTTPEPSAVLDVTSTTQGFLPPRMTYLQRSAIANPAPGLIIYCIDCGYGGEIQFYNGFSWQNMMNTDARIIFGTQVGTDIDGEFAGDLAGFSVSISDDGNILAIGEPTNDLAGSNVGRVRVFRWTGHTWTRIAQFFGGQDNDNNGQCVSVSGDGLTIAYGVPFADVNPGNANDDQGKVMIYRFTGPSSIGLIGQIWGEAVGDYSGWSIALSSDGNRIAIGAQQNDVGGTKPGAGHTRVYEYNGSSWSQLGADIDGVFAGDVSGYTVSISADGTRVAIGAPENDDNGTSSGHVRIYAYSGGTWNLLGTSITGTAAIDRSGTSVSLSADGSTVAIGAPGNDDSDTESGQVRIFQYTGGAWVQKGLAINGEAEFDRCGISVSLSDDGNRVAIGAYQNDGTTGIDSDNRGHVRIYYFDGLDWSQLGEDIDGEASSDNSGYSVSLSGDGSRVAIGAFGNDIGGALVNAGHVRVFQ